jgi:hypothetical protein
VGEKIPKNVRLRRNKGQLGSDRALQQKVTIDSQVNER